MMKIQRSITLAAAVLAFALNGATLPASAQTTAPATVTTTTGGATITAPVTVKQPDTVQLSQPHPGVTTSDALTQQLQQLKLDSNPKPEQLEALYHAVWHQVANNYHDQHKLAQWGAWQTKYDGKLKTKADLEGALSDMLASLNDPYTQYITAAQAKAEADALARAQAAANAPAPTQQPTPPATTNAQAKNTAAPSAPPAIYSLGMSLSRQWNGTYTVDYLTYGSPAYGSDLRHGDLVKSIGGKALAGMTPQDVRNLLVGKDGDKIEIVFNHDKKDDKLSLTVKATPKPQLEGGALPEDMLYLHMPEFGTVPIDELHTELLQAVAQGKVKGLLIDLRGNPGGQLQSAIDFVSMFMPKGDIVSATTRDGKTLTYSPVLPTRQSFAGHPEMARAQIAMYNLPIVVITDESTANAAEVVASALQDNKRAIVVGTQTYGNGLGVVRETLPTGGALTLTTSDYLTPSGDAINGNGIKPDAAIARKRGSQDDEPLIGGFVLLQREVNKPHVAAGSGQQAADDGDDSGSPSPFAALINTLEGTGSVALMLLVLALWGLHYRLRKEREKAECKKSECKSRRCGS